MIQNSIIILITPNDNPVKFAIPMLHVVMAKLPNALATTNAIENPVKT